MEASPRQRTDCDTSDVLYDVQPFYCRARYAMNPKRDVLKLALLVVIGGLVASVIPVWPYGFYKLLRLVVTGVAVYALHVFGIRNSTRTAGLALVALAFNPVLPVHLPRLTWLPIDLAVAYWFWVIVKRDLSR